MDSQARDRGENVCRDDDLLIKKKFRKSEDLELRWCRPRERHLATPCTQSSIENICRTDSLKEL